FCLFLLRAEPYQALFRFRNSPLSRFLASSRSLSSGPAPQTLSEPLSLYQLGAFALSAGLAAVFLLCLSVL
ncbi:hypothetical protein ABTX24_05020, partial [Nocardioides sp. NPDC127514]|uniref:hypothetical protein n=1 Tax=Nocardioides sp. NPDC127514 TaxID=3154243 RepID=UPI003322BADA